MNRLITIVCSIALISCGSKKETNIPETILPLAKMADVLVDVNILEASLGLNVILEKDTAHKDTNLFFNVFESHQITQNQYNESMNFYMNNPELLHQIYDSVLVKLDAEKGAKESKK